MRGDRKCAARWSAFNPIQVKQTPGESRTKRTGNVVFTLAPINMLRQTQQLILATFAPRRLLPGYAGSADYPAPAWSTRHSAYPEHK